MEDLDCSSTSTMGLGLGLGLKLNPTAEADEAYSDLRGRRGASASTPIDSSNIGFQLLKKHGWKEGTGLGISEQGRLEPIQAYLKQNKRGLGADKPKKAIDQSTIRDPEEPKFPKRKAKGMSKKLKKMQEHEKRLQEKEFDRSFFREFWPDNV